MKSKYILENVKRLLSSKLFMALTFILVIMLFVQALSFNEIGVYSSSIGIFTSPLFLILCYFPMFIFLTQYNLQLFDKDTLVIIRLKSKKKYLIELIKNIIATNSILFIICLVVLFICQNLTNTIGYRIENIGLFHTTSLVYMIYVFIRLYIITVLLSILLALLFKKFNKNIILLISFIFLGFTYMASYNIYFVDDLVNFRCLISDILVNNIEFSSFNLNIIHSFVNILLIIVANMILYNFVVKKMKEIGE